ncbi:HPr family phosphocarrier protein [Paenibacillus sp. BR2-3]|uniref:HPr family phosphocarrier protein n=1 Tax=Paenibacillus sp. BR2-3 TaxID=3048494 RepID=UPI003977C660
MNRFTIKLSSVKDVKDFVNMVKLFDFDIDLFSDRYVIDAKSIMGIFSVDLSQPLTLRVHSDAADDVDQFKVAIDRFLV